ncbi:MAG: acyl-CoA desaturase [Crocinitomicaceae bacterium]|nr:acyl-CoA desaturase [Crocinitomicaceae bacterium]
MNQVKFAPSEKDEFYKVVRKRVNQYFKENNISRFANANMVMKTIFMLSLYLVPFVLLLTFFDSAWMIMLMWVLMGFGMAGLGLSVMHDANHSAYSKNKYVNVALGKIIWLIGGSDVNWRIQHNVLHHTYTNVTDIDEDIQIDPLMRFSPAQKMRKAHRFQHLYAWFLYGMMTLMWSTTKDYSQWKRYKDKDLIKTQGLSSTKFLWTLISTKTIYLAVLLTLPLLFSSLPWWGTILGFVLMHFFAGLTLAAIFQPAHVIPTSTFETPNKDGLVEIGWAENQMMNTANFAPKARMFSWYVGGLNYQIEHHLFPNICHVHYRKISDIVRDTAFEYKLPYYSYKTFFDALSGHAKLLYRLGNEENAPGLHQH